MMVRSVVITGSIMLLTSCAAGAVQTPPAQTPPAGSVPVQPAPTPPAPQAKPQPEATAATSSPGAAAAAGAVAVPSDYVIGPDDVLAVVFWREKDLSADPVVVRPDGKITLPLLNDIQAAGLTPDQLRAKVMEAANRFVEDATASVVVKAINSRRFYVTGQVNKPGTYLLSAPTTVLQALAMAGGIGDFAKKDRIMVMRQEGTQTKTLKFNYKEVLQGKNLPQNIELKPGDTIVVP